MNFETIETKDKEQDNGKNEEFEEWITKGNWLTTEFVQQMEERGTIIGAITSTPKLVQKEYKDNKFKRLRMDVDIMQRSYLFEMTKRDAEEIAKKYGTNLSKWVGKTLKFDTVKTNVGISIRAKVFIAPAQPEQNSGSAHINFENQMRLKDEN